ncbi:hypothetical protein ACQ4M4_23170 [Leptolyngbya sp. AN02str]|uniref:hypothetical protein n=1 Tax=Leptolyngbya sp. AN02str TaxID=3423363 RepID=UPI003D31A5FF
MKRWISSGLLAVNVFPMMPSGLPVQEVSAEVQECDRAIAHAKRQLESVNDLLVIQILRTDMSQLGDAASYPADRPMGYILLIDGENTDQVAHSSWLLNQVSTSVVEGCRTVSLVTFYSMQTNWTVTFGLRESGNVEPFACEGSQGDRSVSSNWYLCTRSGE